MCKTFRNFGKNTCGFMQKYPDNQQLIVTDSDSSKAENNYYSLNSELFDE
jgi:phage/plasmid primase-like uncharacterized protein